MREKTFKEFISEQKNTHMTHIEDKVIYGGVNGTRDAILGLRSLRDTLGGEHDGSISVKWDGAPAIFAGIDPSDGRFFVAKKSIFNKSPKVYKTDSDIDADTSGDLNAKFKQALRYLPSLGIKGVIQGDFLYGPGDVKTQKIKGKDYVTFHPNTIVYAIPAGTPMAKEILKKKIGVVWHTSYSGSSFENMRASYGVDVSKLKSSNNVWSQDAMLRDMTKFTMNKRDTEEVNGYLKTAGKLFNQIQGSTLRELEANQKLAGLIETYNNTFVRSGTVVSNTRQHVNGLVRWVTSRYNKEIRSLKTPAAKTRKRQAMKADLDFFSARNKPSLIKLFELQKVIILAKLKLINILNKLNRTQTFLKTRRGFRTTGQEGYVAIDKLGGDAVKIVDRMEFSFANFNPTILKGWDKPGRT